MAITIEDLINQALSRIRYAVPVGSIFEGSVASRAALQVYGQTRDALFNAKDWDHLRTEVSLGAPVKTAPPGGYGTTPWDPINNPPPPWVYSYNYPDLCVQIRSLRPLPIFIPEFTPQFIRFVTAYDTVSGTKVVLTNAYQPLAVITGQINDPNEWRDAAFTEALIDALAVQLEKHVSDDANKVMLAEKDAAQAEAIADGRRG